MMYFLFLQDASLRGTPSVTFTVMSDHQITSLVSWPFTGLDPRVFLKSLISGNIPFEIDSASSTVLKRPRRDASMGYLAKQ
jgi:hypothetical protein